MDTDKYHIFDNLLEGVQVLSPDWRYLYMNDAAAIQNKRPKEELLGYTMPEKYPGIEAADVYQLLRSSIEERKTHQAVILFQFPDGDNRYFDLRIQPVPDGILILSFDVTRQKKMELELQQLNESLEQQVKERTRELANALDREKQLHNMKSDFVSMASHEFRTPLSIIRSSVALLEHHTVPEQKAKHIARIKSSVKDLDDLLHHFLTLEQLDQGTMKTDTLEFDLPGFVRSLIQEIQGITKDNQAIYYEHTGNETVILDRQIMRSILLNLLSNAIKYSDQHIYLATETDHSHITITITDKGIGIPEEEQENLFHRFFRARNASNLQGTGLGLNIVKHYVELLDGTISFTSKQGEGTTFVIRLPNDRDHYPQ